MRICKSYMYNAQHFLRADFWHDQRAIARWNILNAFTDILHKSCEESLDGKLGWKEGRGLGHGQNYLYNAPKNVGSWYFIVSDSSSGEVDKCSHLMVVGCFFIQSPPKAIRFAHQSTWLFLEIVQSGSAIYKYKRRWLYWYQNWLCFYHSDWGKNKGQNE